MENRNIFFRSIKAFLQTLRVVEHVPWNICSSSYFYPTIILENVAALRYKVNC
jgi:hypothetical protein